VVLQPSDFASPYIQFGAESYRSILRPDSFASFGYFIAVGPDFPMSTFLAVRRFRTRPGIYASYGGDLHSRDQRPKFDPKRKRLRSGVS
jgi:hypothetical protein